jgi:hypothetical protein
MGPSIHNHWLAETSAAEAIPHHRNQNYYFGGDSLIFFSHRIDGSHDLWHCGNPAQRQEI